MVKKNKKEFIKIDDEIFLVKKSTKSKSKKDKRNKIKMKNKEVIIKKNSNKKTKNKNLFSKVYVRNLVFISCMFITFITFYYSFIYPFLNEQFIMFKERVLPNTYVNNNLVGNKMMDDVDLYIDNYVDNIRNKVITFSNINGNYEYDLSNYNLKFNDNEVKNEVRNNTSFINLVKRLIYGDPKREYNIEIIEDDDYNNFIEDIKEKVNVNEKNGVFVRDEKYKISFVGYRYGFVLDEEKIDNIIHSILNNDNLNIELPGQVIDFDNVKLLDVNKKIAEVSTDYSGNASRKKNIELAVSKLNGTILYPNDVFSYYKEVGPYNSKNGYYFYHDMVGSGVCQVSSTLYNVELLAGLKTVYRAPHGKKIWYLPGGLDATVYGSYTDFKFKNTYQYPIYINAYTKNNYVYISIWSNSKVNENVYYKLRSVKVGTLSYKVYRDKYENGKLTKTEYINSTKYFDSY